MTKFFTGAPSNSASCVLLDTVRDECVGGRVWSLVSTRDISGNTIYGVSYSETDLVWWFPTLSEASAHIEHINNCDRMTF